MEAGYAISQRCGMSQAQYSSWPLTNPHAKLQKKKIPTSPTILYLKRHFRKCLICQFSSPPFFQVCISSHLKAIMQLSHRSAEYFKWYLWSTIIHFSPLKVGEKSIHKIFGSTMHCEAEQNQCFVGTCNLSWGYFTHRICTCRGIPFASFMKLEYAQFEDRACRNLYRRYCRREWRPRVKWFRSRRVANKVEENVLAL